MTADSRFDGRGEGEDFSPPSLSIIIPAYNEELRISVILNNIVDYLRSNGRSAEVIVVDDGSRDKTADVALSYKDLLPLRVLQSSQNCGKGAAVRLGVLNSRGSRVLFLDADGSAILSQLTRLESHLDQGYQISFGSRALHDPSVRIEARIHRKLLGRVFHSFARWILPTGIQDSQCGFKLFTREAALEVFRRLNCNGFSFDVELFVHANQLNLSWKEVAIDWHHTPNSKLNLTSTPIKMLGELVLIGINKLAKVPHKEHSLSTLRDWYEYKAPPN
jgi:dolichyl-phosphate beta-glucosyltransferase